jgi:DNA (cytosine-5)-methyltransferase 1
MKYFSMFSGIGGFEYGIDRAIRQLQQKLEKHEDSQNNQNKRRLFDSGSTCVGYSEIDKYADQIYQKHTGGKNYGDATKINPKELPDFDLLVGGFPCQAFSIAGKRKGFDDTRGTLFFDIARILAEKKPKHLVLENVKGLLSHDQGRTFQTILGVLADLGYRVEWQVLNSKDFGVPQNRERVIIVGHLGTECSRKIFPITGANSKDIKQLNQPKHSNDRVYSEKGISPTLNTMQGGNRQPFIQRQPLRFLNRNQKNIEGDYAYTVDSSQTSGVKIEQRIRRLTPIECERLQGFPDNWTEGLSDTQRYKTLGNAVTTNVITAVMEVLYG